MKTQERELLDRINRYDLVQVHVGYEVEIEMISTTYPYNGAALSFFMPDYEKAENQRAYLAQKLLDCRDYLRSIE